ncbi:MAG TPA: PDZ domain-containing protein [Pyrinomonadaceae bacterium]|nr:PDZ domain-containing protein [Pyrinomonadaceae bacterium]
MKQAAPLLLMTVILATSSSVWAQASKPVVAQQAPTAPTPPPRKSRTVRRPVVVVDEPTSAPQVVTILHRLNGLKMFRLLLRSGEGIDAVTKLDDAFKIKDEVHTSVIAGVAIGDGETIAARLPQADAELGPAMAPVAPWAPQPPGDAPPIGDSGLLGVGNLFDRPDVTVIGRDGRRLVARYIGLDGVTGLSVLKLAGRNSLPSISSKDLAIMAGQRIRLLAPEPVEQMDQRASSRIHVRIGETEAKVVSVTRAPSGSVARIRISSNNLTPANIGGVAINDAGETVGIVEAVERDRATLLPNAMVHSAAKRVLEKQASVPRPWLGIRGEPLGTFPFEQMVRGGWQAEKAKSLWQHHSGIFLTSVAPGSPAAGAALKPGDVILRVNEGEVKNADEFSWSLEEIPAGNPVSFTIARPGQMITEAVEVTLSSGPVAFYGSTEDESTNPNIEVERIVRSFSGAASSLAGMLMSEGIETIALKPAAALHFGAGSGLLVVYVNPQAVAYKSGLRSGDVIESINGRPVLSDAIKPVIAPGVDYSLNVVRNRERIVVKIAK